MPASIPVDNTLGALFVGAVLSSIIYGVTWLQVYSYYNSHCSKDRWPLKLFVAFLMLVDTVNLVFNTHMTYHIGVTNFGDYQSNTFKPWSQPATTLSAVILDLFVQHYYAYRIYRLGECSSYLPTAISLISKITFNIGICMFIFHYLWVAKALLSSAYATQVLKHIHEPGNRLEGLFIATLSCDVLCDVLITFGMIYSLLSKRTQVRRTNVLNLVAVYSLNCGALHLVFSISCLALLAKDRDTLVYVPCSFIMTRLYPCAVMSILNSRDDLRDMLDGPGGVVATSTQLKVCTATPVLRDAQDTKDVTTNMAVPKSLVVSSDTSFSDSVITFDGEKYPVPPAAETVTV
ncbi:hypothetical protein EDB87DRAFT_276449 [Lactarius vividus]|nr:hypothetical protein EDB87DRAFT_276449 [Lactarius vividus]